MGQKNSQLKFYLSLSFCFITWAIVFFNGYSTAIEVWLESEIYNHCFFVIPCSLYFIYARRYEYKNLTFTPTFLPLLLLTPLLFVQLFSQIGDIKVLMHIATFTSIPFLVWALVGNKVAKVIVYPLCFMVFSIPIGDQLVPFLQELTTDLSVPLLKLTGIPVFRNGLYIDIPEGQFLVAEACSGISFLISTIVFGFFYAYISFQSIKKRVVFIVISIIVPLLANALRVYGIILTGHLTDMEHAVGADHLVYGGVFFGIVLFILIVIGEKFRDVGNDSNVKETVAENTVSEPQNTPYKLNVAVTFIVLCVFQQVWLNQINYDSGVNFSLPDNVVKSTSYKVQLAEQASFAPKYIRTTLEKSGTLQSDKNKLDFFIGYYNGVGGELVSSSHREFDLKAWSRRTQASISIEGNTFILTEIVALNGQSRLLVHWYEVAGKHFAKAPQTKLYQTLNQLTGQDFSGVKIILAFDKNMTNKNEVQTILASEIKDIRSAVYQSLQN